MLPRTVGSCCRPRLLWSTSQCQSDSLFRSTIFPPDCLIVQLLRGGPYPPLAPPHSVLKILLVLQRSLLPLSRHGITAHRAHRNTWRSLSGHREIHSPNRMPCPLLPSPPPAPFTGRFCFWWPAAVNPAPPLGAGGHPSTSLVHFAPTPASPAVMMVFSTACSYTDSVPRTDIHKEKKRYVATARPLPRHVPRDTGWSPTRHGPHRPTPLDLRCGGWVLGTPASLCPR